MRNITEEAIDSGMSISRTRADMEGSLVVVKLKSESKQVKSSPAVKRLEKWVELCTGKVGFDNTRVPSRHGRPTFTQT